MPAPFLRTSLVDQVIASLRDSLASGKWPVDSRLPTENELSESLQVGRNTVREAVRVLTHSGMLEVRQGDGTYVRRATDSSEVMRRIEIAGWRDHLELHSLLESEMARFAALRRTDEDIKRMEAALAKRGDRSKHKSDDAFYKHDHAFHAAVARASHNVALEELYAFFARSARERMAREVSLADLEEPSFEAHRAIVDAVRAQDPKAALRAAKAITHPMVTRAASQK